MKKFLAVLLTVVFCLAISGLAIAKATMEDGVVSGSIDEGVVSGGGELETDEGVVSGEGELTVMDINLFDGDLPAPS